MNEVQKNLSVEQMLAVVKMLKLKKGEYVTINGLRVSKTDDGEKKK